MSSRRVFLKSGGLAVLAASLGGLPSFLARTASAVTDPGPFRRRKTLVTIFQRGAMDGLAAVQPFGDPLLRQHRPGLVLDPSSRADADERLIDLNGHFGLHPAFEPLHTYYSDGRLGIVHGMGSPVPTRSHFDAQDFMETGIPGDRHARTGWLNRAVGLAGHDAATPFRAVALTPALPLSLRGDAPAFAVSRLSDFGVTGGRNLDAAIAAGQSLESLYARTTEDLLADAGQDGFDAVHLLQGANLGQYRPEFGAEYPRSPLGRSLQQIAQLIKADVGLEVAFAESRGWDTHARQGAVQGSFGRSASDLARSMAAFWTDIDRHHDDVVLMTMTEFGRTVAENGTNGTDHGRASCLFVLGNTVDGGRIHGQPLVLDPDGLEDGRDLAVTTDFRSVFSGIAAPHLGLTDDAALFPGWSGERLPLIRA